MRHMNLIEASCPKEGVLVEHRILVGRVLEHRRSHSLVDSSIWHQDRPLFAGCCCGFGRNVTRVMSGRRQFDEDPFVKCRACSSSQE